MVGNEAEGLSVCRDEGPFSGLSWSICRGESSAA